MSYFETREIQTEVYGLQDLVDRNLRNLPVAFAQMPKNKQAEFCNRQKKYVDFELTQLTSVWPCMPIEATGTGLFLVYDSDLPHQTDGAFELRPLEAQKVLTGILGDAHILPIPPIHAVATGEASSLGELCVSVLLELYSPMLETNDGMKPFLDRFGVFLPLAYRGMKYDQHDVAYNGLT